MPLENYALPPAQMTRVDRDTPVLASPALSHKVPVPVLLAQIETRGVGDEKESDDAAGETEPADNPESGSAIDVVVDDGGKEGTDFAGGGRETVCGGADGNGEDLGGEEEGGAVGTELLEEGGEVVDGLEACDPAGRAKLIVPDCLSAKINTGRLRLTSRDQEQYSVPEESDDLHPAPPIHLVVDKESGKVVPNERDTDVDKVPIPADNDIVGGRG
jgi:hypothetical protein